MNDKPTTAQELEELFGKVDFEKLIRDDILKEGAEEFQRQYDKHLMKRRIFYEVIWWGAESRHTKCFYSVKKMRKFVNELHSWYNDYIEIEKNWCYREYSPRHKWYYISFEPNQFVCVEKY